MMIYHKAALIKEAIEGLNINPDGYYVDATFGGGGHSRTILTYLSQKGRLVAFDQDKDAAQNIIEDKRFLLVQNNFRYLKNFLKYFDIKEIDGIIADLGISSHQIDEASRGFSFRNIGKLDMRMNKNNKKTAEYIINQYDEENLIYIFKNYGELPNSKQIVNSVIRRRKEKPINTSEELIETIKSFIPRNFENKFLAQVFQALRIEVNDELNSLKDLLLQSTEVLKTGGRLVVISYHSLEDRLVKNFIKSGNFEGNINKDIFGNTIKPLKAINKNVITPTEEDISENKRIRSAKLRIAEKI